MTPWSLGAATAAVAPAAPTGGLFQSVDSDVASRTLRMSNFPASWVAPQAENNLLTKIRNLLEKFGTLEQAPSISRPAAASVSATATFTEPASAQQAVQTLHNVDNRTELEKKRVNHAPPQESERFCVTLLSASGGSRAPVRDAPLCTARSEDPISTRMRMYLLQQAEAKVTARIRTGKVPSEWSAQDIEEAAKLARAALHGLELQSEVGYNTMLCEVLTEEASGDALSRDKAYDPEAAADTCADHPPFLLFVDEILLSTGDPGPEDREIYLRDLPLEDYTEQQLHEWLDSFGRADRVHFLKDPVTKELTGRGYVKFQTHEEALGLIAAFPVDDAEGNVQGSWSLSERLTQRLPVVTRLVAPRLKGLAVTASCATLVLGGAEQCTPGPTPPVLAALGLEAGPLHFAAWPRGQLASDPGPLQTPLTSLLADVAAAVQQAPPAVPAAPAAMEPAPVAANPVTTASVGNVAPTVAPAAAAPATMGTAAPEASPTGGKKEEHEEELPKSPCIVVRAFPESWQEKQVRLLFALFGGVASVHFATGPGGGRVAYVELKNPDNMPRAVKELHNTQVGDGDLIEECTVLCELAGGNRGASVRPKGPLRRVLFLDDLPMPKRPELAANSQDREVFLCSLPVKECREEQIHDWLEGFGVVEDFYLLRDHRSGELNGRAYVRFAAHGEANACVEAHGQASAAEEGDVVASWSESERAGRRSSSVYGADVHTAFAGPSGRVLASILVNAKMKAQDLWMFSEQIPCKDRCAPKPEGRPLHFIAMCDDEQFEELKNILAQALQNFHEKVTKRLRDSKENRETKDRDRDVRGKEVSPRSLRSLRQRPDGVPPGHSPQRHSPGHGPPPGQLQPRGQQRHPEQPPWQVPASDAWGSFPAPQGSWGDWARSQRDPYAHPAGPPGWFARDPASGGYSPSPYGGPVPDWHRAPGTGGPQRPPAWAYPSPPGEPADWRGSPPPGYCASTPGFPPGPSERPSQTQEPPAPRGGHQEEGDREGPRRKDRDGERARAAEITGDPALEARVIKGEQLVADGKAAVAQGRTEKAYEKYCKGLQYLLDVMPKLGEDRPQAKALRQRINTYLDEAERLKQKIDAEAARAAAVGAEPAGGGREERARPSPRRSEEARDAAKVPAEIVSDIALKVQIEKGEALIGQGKHLEDRRRLDEAYEKYCRGLQYLLEVMPKLGEDSAEVRAIRSKISGYLEQAERLKERLETREAAGGTQDRSGAGDSLSPEVDAATRRATPDAASAGGPGRQGSRHRHRRQRRGEAAPSLRSRSGHGKGGAGGRRDSGGHHDSGGRRREHREARDGREDCGREGRHRGGREAEGGARESAREGAREGGREGAREGGREDGGRRRGGAGEVPLRRGGDRGSRSRDRRRQRVIRTPSRGPGPRRGGSRSVDLGGRPEATRTKAPGGPPAGGLVLRPKSGAAGGAPAGQPPSWSKAPPERR